MLKALELIGFKSFADKTRFEFPVGVSVIVGPNGSGKSNIVDAIKWVLGAQSAKSLRGKEMADVIFNGSGARQAINTAEVTLTLDNKDNALGIDSPDVQITRRVYRSGEGEYFVNRKPCRLRDIKELLTGTGTATEAYSIIEQGKVDVMLQASPRDRRIIFEEAAGISRFKAKKLDASRRLDRVEQNLLRLSDIVDEVDSRLRTIRAQATRARRYHEYTERLKELRTQTAVAGWRQFTRDVNRSREKIATLSEQRNSLTSQLESGEELLQQIEGQVAEAEEHIHAAEANHAESRRQAAELEATVAHQFSLGFDLEDEIARLRQQMAAMNIRAGDDQLRARQAEQAFATAKEEERQATEELQREDAAFREVEAKLSEVQRSSEAARAAHMNTMRTGASLGNQISVLRSQFSSADAAKRRCEKQLTTVCQDEEMTTASLAESEERERQLTTDVKKYGGEFRSVRSDLAERRRQLAEVRKSVAELSGVRAGAVQRANVLEELERQLEGIGSGVRDLLLAARRNPDGPLREVRGLVADLLQVSVEIAPLVEVALGEKAQQVVLEPSQAILNAIEATPSLLSGRVYFLRLDVQPPGTAVDRIDLSKEPGVIERLDRLVEAEPTFIPLVRRLLGRTWLVEDMATAIRLSEGAGRGLDFVTRDGQRIGAGGTLVAGPRRAATGLISRHSELRSLHQEIERLDERIEHGERDAAELEAEADELDNQQESISPKHAEMTGKLSEQRLKTVSLRDRAKQLMRQRETLETELQAAVSQGKSAAADLESSERDRSVVQDRVAELEKQLEEETKTVARLQQEHSRHQRLATERCVAAATSLQRRDALRSQLEQWTRDQHERAEALSGVKDRHDERRRQYQNTQSVLLDCTRRMAELCLKEERHTRKITSWTAQREQARVRRGTKITELQADGSQLRSLEQRIQTEQLAAAHVAQQRDGLVERLHDDYGIELADAGSDDRIPEIEDGEEVEREIQDLRQKIANVGAVNLQAREELDDLEKRSKILGEQYADLAGAKDSLEQIIHRINADSRRMFSATLDTVREHFQELFRRLFGGGHADIILDGGEDVDVLESGIEIIARPPGKDPRAISLLSGGEKTMTCVALLLAIFRSRPSPFCVLDEVDAALDEANIERFTSVLNEFLTSTQFIVITHSKKTMTHADTLYGITMQESGISKQVSVRFKDVSDDGTIREPASDDSEAA